jgi:hypothetical protein
MIGLPDVIGVSRFLAIEQIKGGAVRFAPGMCQGHQGRVLRNYWISLP